MIFKELFSFKAIRKQRLCTLKFKYNEPMEILPVAFRPDENKTAAYLFSFFVSD
ncbi:MULTISPECIES: hypothetical protein [Leptospira]|uniref:Uncharacterized protein n=1 Tax=Leptospira weilii str. 2006001855 TaxID=996804 RepID=M6FL39_9LEPT|nr:MULTISPECIES: hypothetical protein [Leptospira]EMM70854.1 hypothetical protein LEP1GSC038_0060 [Leptospira weilii str. 2006001855]MCL8268598.1 hypothetical protein [Leptospira weilii]ULH28283.1 hypothetical protein FH586_18370 [Leptospira weilii]UPY80153.1 hypothetical protein FH581_019305 [Leptospira weilii]